MRVVKRRLTFHFLLQYIGITLLISTIFVALLILLIWFISTEDLKRSFPTGALESISTETSITDGKADISKGWEEQLQKKDMWFQIVDENGKEIASSNKPPDIKDTYTLSEILKIEEDQRFKGYSVYTELDTFSYNEPYYYLLGFRDMTYEQLQKLIEKYSQNGEMGKSNANLLEKEMGKSNTLHLVNEEGKVVQSFGKDLNIEHYNPIEILTREKAPGLYNTRVSVIHDQKTNRIWVLHSKNNMKEAYTEQTFYRDILIAFIIVGVIILLITISIAVWHGFRYGRPIIIFTSWLERMEHGQYQEVLTENERKRIFRKNGKVKVRYRLYQEVFQAFYNMAETLSSTEKERKRLDQTREEWMTGISHDLRTPLASVQGYGHLLESDKYEWSNDEIKDMGKVIREKGEYMLGLVEDFSLAFQLKNNSLYYLKERILLNDFLKDVVQKYKNDRMLGNVNISFVEEVKNIELDISRKWFERIFDNLIMNAIKHNPPNTAIFVTLKKAIDPQFVEIAVEDQGVGMNEEMQENLFERYFRGTNTEEKVDGAGLGMSIAKEIVKLHNGEIQVTSAVGEGTVIKLRFPVQAKQVEQDE
ncbi:HAMP domain-containing histidine kinase [Metabacillus litoralis]|uniref:sensor histidine kinase n=1 Tax=Metabacillus litoralis TaxID=152268 RepID=UPI001B95EEC1|nr:HAMP domain-containing sensor histidine kinase [Metabacillus litoralis]UHA60820.1 HAMP domain-containing histidine kinase [Metabacillus litoralis]